MDLEKATELTVKLNQVLENMFWKGVKEHPEKIEFIDALAYFISLAERLDVNKIKTKIGIVDDSESDRETQAQAILTYLLGKDK